MGVQCEGVQRATAKPSGRLRRGEIPCYDKAQYQKRKYNKRRDYIIMAKLYFRYGAMGSSKTANAIMVQYNYEERGQKVLMLKPKLENRDGAVIVRSRCGLETACRFIEDVTAADAQGYGCVIIDEAQFLTKAQVEMLVEMVDDYDVPVIAYGLRADFQNNFFEGSQWLMAWADTIEEIKTICWCGRKATCNARVVDGRVVQEGEQVVLGGNGQYVSLCRKHFRRGELGDFKDLHLGEE
mgnify:FL=1